MGGAKASKRARQESRAAAAAVTFWHGGVHGLETTGVLLPPARTKVAHATAQLTDVASATRVYLTTDYELARTFASLLTDGYGASAVYEVRPIGPVETDRDYPAVAVMAKSASIVRVAEFNTRLSSVEVVQRQARFQTWSDGRPMYSPGGRFLLSPELEARGMSQDELDSVVDRWTSYEDATAPVQRALAKRANSISIGR